MSGIIEGSIEAQEQPSDVTEQTTSTSSTLSSEAKEGIDPLVGCGVFWVIVQVCFFATYLIYGCIHHGVPEWLFTLILIHSTVTSVVAVMWVIDKIADSNTFRKMHSEALDKYWANHPAVIAWAHSHDTEKLLLLEELGPIDLSQMKPIGCKPESEVFGTSVPKDKTA
jgi:hypothetical protein